MNLFIKTIQKAVSGMIYHSIKTSPMKSILGMDVYTVQSMDRIPAPMAMVLLDRGSVMVNRAFYTQFSKEEQIAVIAHEKGHIVHGHGDKLAWTPDQQQAREIEADQYAFSQGYGRDLISALTKINAYLCDGNIRERITLLKKASTKNIDKWFLPLSAY